MEEVDRATEEELLQTKDMSKAMLSAIRKRIRA